MLLYGLFINCMSKYVYVIWINIKNTQYNIQYMLNVCKREGVYFWIQEIDKVLSRVIGGKHFIM